MNIMKHVLLASAAAMTIVAGDASAATVRFFAGNVPTLCMPHATVAVGQALSPHAIAVNLTQRHYRVQAMHRRGAAYAVRAVGPSGNHVDMMVDGSSGTIIGLNVLQAVAGSIVSAMTAQNAVYLDDRHPFGAVVPEVVYNSWQSYGENQWSGASAQTVSVERTYSGYRAAVPFNFVHFNARSGHSYAIAPPKYHGFRLTNSRGQQIRSSETRAQMANEEAAYQSERADQADWQKQVAQQDATDANERADQLDQENDQLADVADRESQRADDAEAKNAELQKQLDDQGTENQEVADDSDTNSDTSDQGGSSDDTATSQDQGGGGAADNSDNGNETAAAPDAGGGSDDTATSQDQGGGGAADNSDSGNETAAAPDAGGGTDEATSQDQGGGAAEEQTAPQQEAAPEPEPQQEAAPEPEQNNDQADQGSSGDDNSGGGDNSGGDDSGGGGDDGN